METKRLMKKKATVRKLALEGVHPDLFDEFKSLRSFVKYNIQKDYNTYLRHAENNLISDPKKFWSYFKNKNINSSDSLFYNNVRYENDCDIANAFADYFSSAFKPSTDFDGNDGCKSNCVGDLVKIESVTYDDVVLAIRELKSSLTVGVDNIPSFIIKGCAEFLICPLLVLFNLSLRTKVFLNVWKQEGQATREQKQGCLQGSCSGPALWNLVANDLLNQNWPAHTPIQAVADDFVLVIKARTKEDFRRSTQESIGKFITWADNNNLEE
ncbi:hypothetical protein AVEN_54612-1 [Araneus ventricosus]|uniref:Reverse transcriptase domain-containing protein n=1 Tax=Araneus ventricosus TaxID=182803 RepID=A0A4Y2BMN3_ARAVE|nr:hypothetical protein AVEN_54612-1 [Araneus ventricosus]